MQVKDKFLRKQINLLLFVVIFFIILFSKHAVCEEINSKVSNYIKNLNFFSSKFIQSNGASLEEGNIYIKDNKVRLDYFYPDRTLIIGKRKESTDLKTSLNNALREHDVAV